jgi:hypothetical protein
VSAGAYATLTKGAVRALVPGKSKRAEAIASFSRSCVSRSTGMGHPDVQQAPECSQR